MKKIETSALLAMICLIGGVSCGEEKGPGEPERRDLGADMGEERDQSGADTASDLDMSIDNMLADDMAPDLQQDMSADMGPSPFAPPVVRELGRGTVNTFERSFQYKLLELKCGDKEPTYAQMIEPEASAARPFPVIAMTQPYAGIDWTGQEVDAKWAARGAGLHLDDSEPNFVQGSGAVIAYDKMTPQQGGEQGVIHLINGFGVLHIFGRFYAGGSVQNDVDDMTCGLSYLAVAPGADTSRIGTWGGSWGGFEAVYGALYAPAEVAPKVGVALTPLTDFKLEWEHVDAAEADPRPAIAQQFRAFFEPYKRRIAQTTGGAPGAGDFSGFVHDDLARLPNPTRFLSVHDSEDALVPFSMNQSFERALGSRAESVWIITDTPLDLEESGLTHGKKVGELYVALLTISSAYLHTALTPPDKQLIIVYDAANLKLLLQHALAQKQRGQGTQDLAARLIELSSARVVMLELTTGRGRPGAEVTAALVNEVFGTGYNALTIAPGLRANGL